MTLGEAAAALWEMSMYPVGRKYAMPRVNELLRTFQGANLHGDVYVSEKIADVRSWFDELGKLGRGRRRIEEAQAHTQTAIAKLEHLIDGAGTGMRVLK